MTLLKPNRGMLRRSVLATVPALLLPKIGLAGVARPGGSSYVGPLDIVPGTVVAYSQRAMSAAKRGSALYSLYPDGNPGSAQSFSSDASTGAAPTAAIATFLDGSAGRNSLWKDQSGSSIDLLPAPNPPYPTTAPIYVGNTIPSFGVQSGEIHPRLLTAETSLWSAGAALTLFAAIYIDAADIFGNTIIEFTTLDQANLFYFNAGASELSFSIITDAGGTSFTYDADLSGLHLFLVTCDASGNVTIKVDGATLSLTQSGDIQPLPAITGICDIFWPQDGDGNSHSRDYELVIAGATTGTEQTNGSQNIAAYYGITLP